MLKRLSKAISIILSVPVHIYRYMIGPFLPKVCRHEPSCSQFALDALRMHGPFTGLWIGTGRILRCRPGGTHGFDPVPKFLFRRYKIISSTFRHYPKCNRLKQ
jgi:uncharacterized protein